MGITERKTRQKQALRERILDAARRIVVREGFAALSMRKIADAIEYSPATLYLHFESRDEIARALCAEGYAQLLSSFEPLAQIADAAERLGALARAYIAFGVTHPETYRLIFMEDASYTGAALGGPSASVKDGGHPGADKASGEGAATANPDAGQPAGSHSAITKQDSGQPDDAVDKHPIEQSSEQSIAAASPSAAATQINPAAGHASGDAAMRLMVDALNELKATGRLRASADGAVLAEAFWASLHGIVALHLTCPVFPGAPLDTVVDVTLTAWFGDSAPARAAVPASIDPAPVGTPAAGERRTPRKPKSGAA
ncbi:TetR/AcrR family transcriptional regulator [Paraburkholderia sp. DHOC27]|uniref:TetR/AcrR family transcriptional regulator n=1 Tax=Paraburkholderia sp. DHOC27 TaxID=2303330 RepID=UPI00216AB5EE|nr:TetR/AcrR family transcriptional regulator [Paraburkholderia sp. DHOC27]